MLAYKSNNGYGVCYIIGSGKTHYIRKCMSNTGCKKLTVAVNESFNISEVISQLSELPLDETFCTVFFNFTFTAVQVKCLLLSQSTALKVHCEQ